METTTMPADMATICPDGTISAKHYNECRRKDVLDRINELAAMRRKLDLTLPAPRAFVLLCVAVLNAFYRLPLGAEFTGVLPIVVRFTKSLSQRLAYREVERDGFVPDLPQSDFAYLLDN